MEARDWSRLKAWWAQVPMRVCGVWGSLGKHDGRPIDSLIYDSGTQEIGDPDWCKNRRRVSLFIGVFQILEQVKMSVLGYGTSLQLVSSYLNLRNNLIKYYSSFSLENFNNTLHQPSPLQFLQGFHIHYLIRIRSGWQHRRWGLISKIKNGILKVYITSKFLVSQKESWDECSAAQILMCNVITWGQAGVSTGGSGSSPSLWPLDGLDVHQQILWNGW